MRKSRLLFACLLLSVPWRARAEVTLSALFKRIQPAVATVTSFDKDGHPTLQGSGFFISRDGQLITNHHVIDGASSVSVKTADGRTCPVDGILAIDVDSDIVKLRVNTGGAPTPYVTPVNVQPLIGEDIVIVGNPLGLESTVSKGIVSGIRETSGYGRVLQISAPISSGSSGSPVLNMKGQVVGVATFMVPKGQALNFAIPSKAILELKTERELIRLPLTASSTLSTKAASNPCLKYLPADWWLVGNVNLEAFFQFMELSKEANPAVSMLMSQYLEMARGMIGIDPRSEVRYATVVLAGNPEQAPQGLLIVKGTFDNATPELRLKLGLCAGMKKAMYEGTALYQSGQIGYCFPQPSTLVLGSPSLLQRSVRVAGKTTVPLSASLRGTLERTNATSLVWAAIKWKVLLDMQEVKAQWTASPAVRDLFSSIEYVSLFSESADDGLLLSAVAYVSDENHSKRLHTILNAVKQQFLDVEGANVFLSSFLTMSDTTLDGNYVRWNTHFTERTLVDLWNTKFVRKKVAKYGQAAAIPGSPPAPISRDAVTNSVGMKMIHVPAGKFMMGSRDSAAAVGAKSRDAGRRYADEHPQHLVSITQGYYIGATEVTQAQWEAVMGSDPSTFEGDDLPVEGVSWNDAVEFCEKLSRKEGKTYRLPTEAEWEYACRAGTRTPFHTGETVGTDQANFDGHDVYGNGRKGEYRQTTTKAGSFAPNAFGLYDMHGNVAEWCSDWYDEQYDPARPSVDPKGPPTGKSRVFRGGSWNDFPSRCRSANRDGDWPVVRKYVIGFRVVAEDL
jgi:formylglycine-generating enzyme required for sulfatase activity